MVYGTQITIATGVYKQLITRGPHIVRLVGRFEAWVSAHLFISQWEFEPLDFPHGFLPSGGYIWYLHMQYQSLKKNNIIPIYIDICAVCVHVYIYMNTHRDMVGSIFIWLPGFPWGFPMKILWRSQPSPASGSSLPSVTWISRTAWAGKKHHLSGSNWQDFFRLERGTIYLSIYLSIYIYCTYIIHNYII